MAATPSTRAEKGALTRRIALFSIGTASVLVVLKAVVWVFSGSVTLLASLADSALDLVASSATFFAIRYAATPPDADHGYGHGKAEAFASLLQAGLVFGSAALIGQEAVRHLILPQPVRQEGLAIGVMAVSIVMTGALVFAQSRFLSQTDSVAVSADRLHYVSDLASNLIALVAIALSAVLGWHVFDALGGLAIAAILLWGAVTVFREASNQLMDHELPDEDRARIADLIRDDARITDIHQLRTRASGPVIHIQMHADLDPELSLETAHRVLVAAEKRVLKAFPTADIMIHPDPRGRAEPHGGAFVDSDTAAHRAK